MEDETAMTRFASHISTLLYAVLLAILAFVTAVILASVGVLIVRLRDVPHHHDGDGHKHDAED